MQYIITSECVLCNECAEICPVSAIVEKGDHLTIDESCISCGRCVEICPVEAIRINKQK